jgi:hypothetical protein
LKKVFTNEDRFMINQVKQLLDEHAIPCFIKNEYASGAMGELSPFDTYPEIWLTDDEWQPKAMQLIEQLQDNSKSPDNWRCSHCGEPNEGTFEICWQCGSEPQNPAS